MSLIAIRVALHGLFPLTPIAAAVQGLIEQIQEEQSRANGGGLKRPAKKPEQRTYTDDDIALLVEAKWEAIEAGRAQETTVPSTRPEPPVEKTQEIEREVVLAMPAGKPGDLPEVPKLTAAVDPQATEARLLRQRMNNDHALILMLAELL